MSALLDCIVRLPHDVLRQLTLEDQIGLVYVLGLGGAGACIIASAFRSPE